MACQLLRDMALKQLRADSISYNSVMSSCARAECWQVALELFEEMGKRAVERQTMSYNAAMSALSGRWPLLVRIFNEMALEQRPRSIVSRLECRFMAVDSSGRIRSCSRLRL